MDCTHRLLIIGPDRHGVVTHALALARHTDAEVVRLPQTAPSPAEVLTALGGARIPTHLHVTDRLLGSDAAAAAVLVEHLARAVPLTVTLHDVPQPSDGPRNFPARSAAYRRIILCARGVQVCSEHERRLLADIAPDPSAPIEVVPLPVDRRVAPIRPGAVRRSVGVLGFLYPGKGHTETLAAMAGIDPRVSFVALGAPSPGHDDLAADVAAAAASQGRTATVSGYLSDAELDAAVATVGVPVAAHRHISASGSINRWIECGRRPLVVDGRYAREVQARIPWAITVVAPAELRRAIDTALTRPGTTWIDEDQWSPVDAPDTARSARRQTALIAAACGALP